MHLATRCCRVRTVSDAMSSSAGGTKVAEGAASVATTTTGGGALLCVIKNSTHQSYDDLLIIFWGEQPFLSTHVGVDFGARTALPQSPDEAKKPICKAWGSPWTCFFRCQKVSETVAQWCPTLSDSILPQLAWALGGI